MANENRRSEERKVELSRKLDEKVDKKYKQEQMKARKKRRKERVRAEKRKNSKFRNSKFGKKWFGMKKWKRIVVYVVLAVLLLALLLFGVVYGIYNSFRNSINEDNLGITTDIEDKYGDTGIFNVALFGVDTRDEDSFSGRSDTIIIVSIDRANNTVKLSSILRDSYVAIEGHKNQKITHAYMYGGAELAIKTLNQNFGMNITDYVTVNFAKVAEAIDVLGGVDLEITERERVEVNNIGDDDDPDFPYIEEAGMVHLNGKQAVVYARIRHIDSDVARSERQRKVLDALLVKARQISPTRYAEVLRTMLSLCETSLSFSEIMSYAPMITQDLNIQSIVIPGDEDNAIGGNYDGAWVWRYDLAAATERLHMFIYGEVDESVTSADLNSNRGSGSSGGNSSSSDDEDADRNETTTRRHTTPTTTAAPTTEPDTPPTTDPDEAITDPPQTEPESTETPTTTTPAEENTSPPAAA